MSSVLEVVIFIISHAMYSPIIINKKSEEGKKVLIPVFTTHFLQADSTKLDFPMDSIHVLYFIYSFKHGPSPCDNMGEIEEVWFGGYGSIPFRPFA